MKVFFVIGAFLLGANFTFAQKDTDENKESIRLFAAFIKGKKLYRTPGACVTCHLQNGKGLEAAHFPPLTNTDWVTGSEEVLIRITLHGVQGPMKVGDKEYGVVPMVTTLWAKWSDEEIAAVLTYIRNEWGNEAPQISPKSVKKIRAKVGKRYLPWTVKELARISHRA